MYWLCIVIYKREIWNVDKHCENRIKWYKQQQHQNYDKLLNLDIRWKKMKKKKLNK